MWSLRTNDEEACLRTLLATNVSNSSGQVPRDCDYNHDPSLAIYSGILASMFLLDCGRIAIKYTVFLRAASRLHDMIFAALIRCPMRFFDTNPSGRETKFWGNFTAWVMKRRCRHSPPPTTPSHPWPFRPKGYCRCLRPSVRPSVRLSVRPWTLPCPHDNSSQIWAKITKFVPNMHHGILSAAIENGTHWPRPSRSFWPF